VRRSAGDGGAGPGAGVDPERAEDVLLKLGAAGDGGDGLSAGGEGDLANPVELLQRPVGGELLLVEVGVARSLSVRRLPISYSTTAARRQMAMWPRTRGSVKWRMKRRPRVDLT
jgi:hypothetical protein